MKIRVHEIECYVGYARPIFRGIHLPEIEAEIAEVCRKDWANRNWAGYYELNMERDDPPPVPATDSEVIDTYFFSSSEDDEGDEDGTYWIYRTYYDLDLSPKAGELIDLTVDVTTFAVTRDEAHQSRKQLIESGAHSTGDLMQDAGLVGDALESFVLQLTAAGFPVHVPEFKDCLKACCERVADELDDDEDETEQRTGSDRAYQSWAADELGDDTPSHETELRLANAGLLIGIDLAYESWVVNRAEGESCVLVDGQPKEGFRTRNGAVAFAAKLV